MYIENPKTKGSGIICCIPHDSECPVKCEDCFFQSGRSYLEPLEKNLPNMPTLEEVGDRIVRVNDGNDSGNKQRMVIERTEQYPRRFYNTSIPRNLAMFGAPVVLTINPGKQTDEGFTLLEDAPDNLMYVRVRVNTWNLDRVDEAVEHYSKLKVPIVLSFMAYFKKSIPDGHESNYIKRKRTMNTYTAITTDAWERIMARYKDNPLVYSCGKIEGERGVTGCKSCGNCLREYFATMEYMND